MKVKHDTFKAISVVVLLLCILPNLSVTSASNELAKGKQVNPPFLKGNNIDLLYCMLNGIVYIEIPWDEPCFVCHGWLHPDWSKSSPEEKKAFMKECTFELLIDGEKVPLKKWLHHLKELETELYGLHEDVMVKMFYVQFKAGQFIKDREYTFTTHWISPDIEAEYTVTVKFV